MFAQAHLMYRSIHCLLNWLHLLEASLYLVSGNYVCFTVIVLACVGMEPMTVKH